MRFNNRLVAGSAAVVLAGLITSPDIQASELSIRAGWGLDPSSGSEATVLPNGNNLSLSAFWNPLPQSHVEPIFGIGYRQDSGPGAGACLFFGNCLQQVNSWMIPVSAGARVHVGDLAMRKLSLRLEFSPSVIFLNQSFLGTGDSEIRPDHDQIVLGLQTAAAVPVALSQSLHLEFALSYFWTRDLGNQDAGLNRVAAQFGMGFR